MSLTNPIANTSIQVTNVAVPVVTADLNGNTWTLVNGAVPVSAAQVAPYPAGAVPLTAASGDVAAATATATLAAATSKTTYITGFSFTSTGATGTSTVDLTVTGTITGTLTFVNVVVAGTALPNTPLVVTFPYPIPASAVNTAIVVSIPTLGAGNLHSAVNAFGFQL